MFPLEAKKEQVKQKRNKSDKNKMRNFAIFATFARANFVGKESNESTVMYQVKSRITPIMERKRNGNDSIMIRV